MAIAAPRFGTEGNDTMTGAILVPQPTGDPVIDPNYWQDELHGLGGNDTLSGLGNNDWLYGDAGNDTLLGQVGDDSLYGGAGVDTLMGGEWTDLLVGGAGADVLDGGAGYDTASYADSAAGVTVNLSTGSATGGDAQGDTFISVEYLTGSAADDVLTGSSVVSSLLSGGGGNDTLTAGSSGAMLLGDAGNDVLSGGAFLYGGAGDDILIGNGGDGGEGSDTVSFRGSTTGRTFTLGNGNWDDGLTSIENIECGDGNDIVYDTTDANILRGFGGNDTFYSGDGGDTLDGGAGNDIVRYTYSGAVTVNLTTGVGSGSYAEGDTLISVERVFAYDGNDVLIGSNADNTLDGGAGDDLLRGGAGADILVGSAGLDTASYYTSAVGVTVNLTTGTGTGGEAQGDVLSGIDYVNGSQFNDALTGGSSPATSALRGWGGNDILRFGSGNASTMILDGGEGRDLVSYWDYAYGRTVNLQTDTNLISIEDVNGSQAADTIIGNGGVNLLNGFNGNDTIDGAGGHDLLDGGAGNDQLHGGSAMDQLTGGAGADSFIFVTTTESPSTAAGRDLITDFSHAQGDRIDLSLIDANAGAAGDQVFTYLGTGAFTGVAGQLHIWTDAGKTIVSGDVNGDKLADFAIALTGILSPVAADFVL
ncbi:calcium-binding protein [Inquilinus sp. YAF38]|uniref:calcium-binding protein n=1 Tax=Inquilinus sp. YAF38 TaxID=3233084 RepID=UPI003F9336DA